MNVTFTTAATAARPLVRFFTTADRPALPGGITEGELSLATGTRLFLHAEKLLCTGLGDPARLDGAAVRTATGTAAMAMKKAGRLNFDIELGEKLAPFAREAVEGAILADYRYEDFKTKKTPLLETVNFIVPKATLAAAKKTGERAATIASIANLARGIANRPGNVVFPETLAEEAQWHARKLRLACKVWDEKQLTTGRFGGILAVGSGSARPPRMIQLTHAGGPKTQPPLVIVGKAVTFDTGGISIKPGQDMEKMIWDKCGGVAVLGAILAIAKLGIKRNVTALIPSAENMPGSRAYRPGDIVTCYDGKHVEIVNTDAEGRMLLADAIAYARRDLKAAAIVDIATLTGACGVALGDAAAGLWASDDKLRDAVLASSTRTGERAWPMPHYPEYDEQIRSEMGLLKNSGGRLAGSCTAAAFLRTFAEKTPWAHLDIAYTAFREKDSTFLARGATAFAMRTLVDLAETW